MSLLSDAPVQPNPVNVTHRPIAWESVLNSVRCGKLHGMHTRLRVVYGSLRAMYGGAPECTGKLHISVAQSQVSYAFRLPEGKAVCVDVP